MEEPTASPIRIIRPTRSFSLDDIREIWRFRELFYFFTWRDLKVRYKQTVVGVFWAIFQPFVTMVVFSVFFGKLAGIPSDGVPYPIFVYTGLLFWQFFSDSLSATSNSLISNSSIITKVYFPRLILPISDIITKFIDLLISAVMLVVVMGYYHFVPHLTGIILIPLLLLITFLGAVGAGLFLASINVKYRDVRYALPFFIQIMLYLTPVIYPASIAGKYSWILAINPMTGVIKAARAGILGTGPVNWSLLGISLLGVSILFVVGIYFFRKTERYFADIV